MISLVHHSVGLISRYVVPFDLLYTLTVQIRLSMLCLSENGLELLDLSGSIYPDAFPLVSGLALLTLSICLCLNIISSGIQFATAQLPLLKLMDCGMTICDLDSQNPPLKVSGNNEPPNALNYVQKSIRYEAECNIFGFIVL
ncbi:hypothetical protein V6N11_020147 [Hibiscus sabdariffa]|uniref:Uncharacterized protein n=1 Tax=Hibiscus sabdariffa TaxID=183260 RepID=A0ABR2P8Q6_9ROSI